ncbi:hypothetical protein [Bradyrhizobium japonicum]|uniref:hypothetical protein n=1 Tax=Bradyrhizobium japonicum TaxID=375 RepID=UPI00040E8CB9|nr:hypothetical protein [Bradyrhizobium japonicum]
MCDNVTNIIRKACAEPGFGNGLISVITEKVRKRLEADPQPEITFGVYCGPVAGPTDHAMIRVQFFRRDWEHLIQALWVGDTGAWNEDTLLYAGSLFEVSANAANQEVLVVFW